jgi:phage protein D
MTVPATRTPFFEIRVESGIDITPWVSSVTVVEDDRQADNCTITIPDPRMIYSDGLIEGSIAEIDLGYAEPRQHALMLRATITKVEESYSEGGVPTLTLKGEDGSIMMGLVEHRRRWHDRTVTSVVREIAQQYFHRIEASLNPDPLLERPVNQDGKTDLAFLQDLAKTYHAKCFVELDEQGEEVLYFIPERRVVTVRRPDRIVLRYRTGPTSNLISFSPAFDSSYIDRLREIHDVDHHGNQVATQDREPTEIEFWNLDPVLLAKANDDDSTKINTLYRLGTARKTDLQRQLAARRATSGHVAVSQSDLESTNDSLESHRMGMTATGTTFGNIWLRAKSRATFVGVNSRFAGDWYVSSVTHRIDTNGFKTEFKCVR